MLHLAIDIQRGDSQHRCPDAAAPRPPPPAAPLLLTVIAIGLPFSCRRPRPSTTSTREGRGGGGGRGGGVGLGVIEGEDILRVDDRVAGRRQVRFGGGKGIQTPGPRIALHGCTSTNQIYLQTGGQLLKQEERQEENSF